MAAVTSTGPAMTSGHSPNFLVSRPTNPPCTLIRANNFAVDGDELLIAPGDYDIGAGNLLVTKALDVHGGRNLAAAC